MFNFFLNLNILHHRLVRRVYDMFFQVSKNVIQLLSLIIIQIYTLRVCMYVHVYVCTTIYMHLLICEIRTENCITYNIDKTM